MKYAYSIVAVLCITGCSQTTVVPENIAQSNSSVAIVELFTSASSKPIDAPIEYTTVQLHFGNLAVIQSSDCSATLQASRKIAKTDTTADTTLRLLFAGTKPQEEANGMIDMFTAKSQPLLDSYTRIDIQPNKIARVHFTSLGMEYLNAEACIQSAIKSSIVKTLTQFAEITDVEYIVNGKHITEWDA